MSDAVVLYRDDGPVAETVAAASRRLPVPTAAATPLAAIVLVALTQMSDGRSIVVIVALALFVLITSSAAARADRPRMLWLTPPLLRASEYGFITWLAWREGVHSLPAAYALLAAVAFHHYDVVYRLRHQKVVPPAWVRAAGLGWDGRMILLLAASLADVFVLVAWSLVAWCALLFVTESVASWASLARDVRRTVAMAAEPDEE